HTAVAQERRITGIVTGMDNKPVENASVIIRGKPGGTTSDALGKFTIDAKPGDVVTVSMVGFGSREITIGNSSDLRVSLSAAAGSMDEVIVVGYGQMKRTDVSSSQVSVTEQDIQRTINPTFDQ